ncbi:diaminopimelate decarboxylase [Candidatus Kinetoplastibacterium desouzaii TCC079E]|uniref:Diaminopimelate decarboxylase n=1 Tax=Candidatus Kinetoplastidibacterium desouzai TCC079E TaxID=1208919 RepID=M1LVI6_9PROT|nr:diaminopimelate decarboxylase [Candidatus Kinetoplastibacterium desouzaii]AGF47254.1 diaminopimelate decarboxylase [Candidatus Kinetoplastibacterium desouzaii TCC079E]
MKNNHLKLKNNIFHVENINLELLANKMGTPLYVYSRAAIKDSWNRYAKAILNKNCLICYGMKANSNLAILKEFSELGSGFDIVSGGELERALAIGANPQKIVFSGVGKQEWEIIYALKSGIKCFNIESEAELHKISDIASNLHITAPISIRVNPDVDAKTHPYISTGLKENKFGISIKNALNCYKTASKLPFIDIVGIDCHIGSQLTEIPPFIDALDKLIPLIKELIKNNISIKHLDIGGGLGITYKDEVIPDPKQIIDSVILKLKESNLDHLELILEPGRSLIGNCGILLTKVIYIKHSEDRNFVIVDAAMNDLLRPALYQSYHEVKPVAPRTGNAKEYDVVGPICESADWLAKNRLLNVQENDLLIIESAGAYCTTMSSNYNSRVRPAEVIVDDCKYYIIKNRENLSDILKLETTI